mmetsp:Transcript_72346/g.169410  ORF Transcript_72346/g.169410 Transcript_72346/m.169410 type:complete len:282 (+) Transcript_72346:1293-2138(+)
MNLSSACGTLWPVMEASFVKPRSPASIVCLVAPSHSASLASSSLTRCSARFCAARASLSSAESDVGATGPAGSGAVSFCSCSFCRVSRLSLSFFALSASSLALASASFFWSFSLLISSSSSLICFSKAASFALKAFSCSARSLCTSSSERPLITGAGSGPVSFGVSGVRVRGLDASVCNSWGSGALSRSSMYFIFQRSAAARAASSCRWSASFSSLRLSYISRSFCSSSSRSTSSPKAMPLWGFRPKGSLPFLYLEGSKDRIRRTFSVMQSIMRSLRSSSN